MKKASKNIIYRVIGSKGKYQQSYDDRLAGAYSWAVDCAKSVKGKAYKVTLDNNGKTESSVQVYPSDIDKK